MAFRRLIIAKTAALLSMSVAAAEPPYPLVDFEGDWVISGNAGEVMRARMYYSAGSKLMRIEMNQQGAAMTGIQDLEKKESVMWSDQMPGMGMRIDLPDTEPGDARATEETKTVAGQSCTVWIVHEARACLTPENIPLETTGAGFTALLENLELRPQETAIFEPPADLQIMDMPAGVPGASVMPEGVIGLPF